MSFQDVLFYVLFLAPFAVLALYRDKTSWHVLKVSCASTLMLFYLVCDHVGLLLLYHGQEGVKHLTSTDPNTVILLAFYSLVVVTAYVTSGYVMGRNGTHLRLPDVQVLRRTELNLMPLLLIVAVATPLAIWKVLDNSPLLLLLGGDARGATAARLDEVTTGTHFLGIKPSYLGILWSLLAFVQIVFFIAAITRKKLRDIFMFVFLTVVIGLESFANVAKGAIVGPLYIILFTYALVYARGVLINKSFGWAVIFVLSVVAIFSAWAMGSDFSLLTIWFPFERLILGNLIPQYIVVDKFTLDNLLYGTTTPTWFSFGAHKQFLLDEFAWKELTGWTYEKSFYTAPSSFVAEAHANFYVFGVLAMSFLIFFALRTIDYLIMKIRSEIIYAAVMIDSALHFSVMSIQGAVSAFVSYYYLSILLFALVFYRITFLPRISSDRLKPQTVMHGVTT